MYQHTLSEAQDFVKGWHKRKFPDVEDTQRPSKILMKFCVEVHEFMVAVGLVEPKPGEKVGYPPDEAVDIIITLLGFAAFSGYDLGSELETKRKIIDGRTFVRLEDGSYVRTDKWIAGLREPA